MTEHLTDNSLTRYRQHKLTTSELLAIDAHIQQCEACQQRVLATESANPNGLARSDVDELRATLTASHAERSEHLTYEELEAFVDETALTAARSLAETHLRECARCAAELANLRAFRVELAQENTIPIQPVKENFWQSLTGHWFTWPSLALASLLLVFLVTRALRSSPPPPTEVAQTPAPVTVEPQKSPENLPVKPNDQNRTATPDQQIELAGLAELSVTEQQLVRTALANGKVLRPAVTIASGKDSDVLLGSPVAENSFALLSPVGQVVLTSRPTLRWQALKEAENYRVTIFTDDYKAVAESPVLTDTSWRPAQDLPRDRVYLWQVTATKAGQEFKAPLAPAPEARFHVVKQSLADEIAITARRRTPASELLLGLLYARAGLFDEAERTLTKTARQNLPAAQQLLNDLRAQRRTQMR